MIRLRLRASVKARPCAVLSRQPSENAFTESGLLVHGAPAQAFP
jgi:hypothetical protein